MKFLIVKTSSLGDLIHAFPIVTYLRKKYPHSQIDWVVEKPFADLIKAHPHINTTLCIDSKKWRSALYSGETRNEFAAFRQQLQSTHYNAIFDLQSNIKSSLIMLLAHGEAKVGFGRNTVHEWPNLLVTNRKYDPPKGQNIRDDNLFVVQNYFKDATPYHDEGVSLNISKSQQQQIENILAHPNLQNKPRIMVCSGSNWRNKQLPLETLEVMLCRANEHYNGSFLFAWGNQEEKIVAEQLQAKFQKNSVVIDRLPLPLLQNLMGKLELVIAMDSLPLHLAGTTATPTFSVFGASSGAKFCPSGERHRFVQGPCPYGRTFEKRCSILRTCKTGACIREMDPESIAKVLLGS